MNMRRLPFVLVLTVSAMAAACSDPPPVENPPQPTNTPTAEPVPTETAAPTATAAMTAAPSATAVVEAPPPPKPAKDKIVGTWMFSFEGEPKAKAEEELHKKFAKEKDTKKFDEALKKVADEAAGEWIEFKDGYYISHTTDKGKDKVVLKVKYEVVKDDNTSLTTKAAGKADVGKIDPKVEVTTTFTDDNTIEMMDPNKKIKLVFKRKM